MSDSAAPPIPEVQGELVTPLDHFWLDTAQGMTRDSITALEDAAKQLVGVTSLAQVIYFAAISFGDVRKTLSQYGALHQWGFAGLLLVPLVFWIASLWFATRVFKPEEYATNLESPALARELYARTVAYKQSQLNRAHALLVIGFILLLINVLFALVLLN